MYVLPFPNSSPMYQQYLNNNQQIVCGDAKRTIKALSVLAQGCWGVTVDWVNAPTDNTICISDRCFPRYSDNRFPRSWQMVRRIEVWRFDGLLPLPTL